MLVMCTTAARHFVLPMLHMRTSQWEKFMCHCLIEEVNFGLCLGLLDVYYSDLNVCIAETITIVVDTKMT
jgi:hypothetical protein